MSDRVELEDLPPHEVFEKIEEDLLTIVYRAHDVPHNRIVALTVIKSDKLPEDALWRLLSEALAAARIDHPHLLPILRVGLHAASEPCYTMPLTPYGSLLERRDQFRDPRAAADLVEKLARATAAAHAHGMLHGGLDLKEVRFDEHNQPRVGGFGLFPVFHSIERNMAAAVSSRWAYLAPEQIGTQAGALGAATDIWALGVILYELLTGRQPFAGKDSLEILRRVQSETPIRPRRLRRDIDRELEAIALRCLQKRPDDRYGSARALADDLERWLRAEPTEARPESWWRRFLRAL